MKLICVDPRRTMVAQLADIHLQVRPARMRRWSRRCCSVILDEGLHDREFCARHVDGLDALHAAWPASRPRTPRAVPTYRSWIC